MKAQAKVKPEVLLGAGALIPADARLPEGTQSDLVSARSYSHPALGDRVVVRLPSKPLAPAEDLELELLGFTAPSAHADVARRRRRALGFPGWALVHQPKRATVALGLVKELKKASKLARSKPGHAKEAFEALGKQLARSVPAFLPSFFEEAGRAFIDHGNVSFAAGMFARAREAERTHALKVDPDARQTAFLEFALAGALSGKVLTAYGSELSETETPAVAYARFRELAVKRLLGGMPPWAGMGSELRRLCKAARLDLAKEEPAFLSEILEAPVLARAPDEFWTTYQPALVALCAGSDAAKLALLKLTPVLGYSDRGAKLARWLNLVDACGAIAPLEAPRAACPAALAALRPAEWLQRMISAMSWRSELPEELPRLLRRLAPRLKEEAVPLILFGRWSRIDVDLLDLALELGVPVATPSSEARFDLSQWAKRSGELGRDPAFIAADARFRKGLEQAVAEAFGEAEFDTTARGKPVLATLRRAHLETLVAPVSEGLPTFAQQLATLTKVTTAATFAEFPDAFSKLKALSVRPCLEFTLRSGIADELGWPAFDAAVAELTPKKGDVTLDGFFPYLCLYNPVRAIVLGPRGRVLEHDFRVPPRHEVTGCYFVASQLRVVLRGPRYEQVSYWSAAPTQLHPLKGYWFSQQRPGVELADGSIVAGARAFAAGDTDLPSADGKLVSDGTTFWNWQYEDRKHALFEVDPRTGKRGRRSWPSFFTEGLAEGEAVSHDGSALLPAPLELTASPLGVKAGLTGVRWRKGIAERIDGLTVAAPESVDGIAMLPGGAMLLLSEAYRTQVRVPGEEVSTSSRLAPTFWHLLSARDVAGSEALRRVGAETCEGLLSTFGNSDVAAVDPDFDPDDDEPPAAPGDLSPASVAQVATLLPELTHPALREGVARTAAVAAELARRLAQHVEGVDPARTTSAAVLTGRSDEHLKRAVAGFCGTGWNAEKAFDQVLQIAELLAGRRPSRLAESAVSWQDLIGHGGALAFVATSPAFGADQRAAAADLLEAFAGTPFLEANGFRRLTFAFDAWKTLGGLRAGNYQGTVVFSFGDSTYICTDGHQSLRGVEHSKGGGFRLPRGATLNVESPVIPSALTSDVTRAFVAAVRSRGPRTLDRAPIELVSQQTGLTFAEAALLWNGFPGFATREANFLDKTVREALGLKVNDARAARQTFEALDLDTRAALLTEATGASPLEFYDAPLAVAQRLAEAWNRRYGKRAAVPAEVIAQAHAELHDVLPPASVLGAMIEPSRTAFGQDGWFRFVDGELQFSPKDGEPDDVFTGKELVAAAAYIPWVFLTLPAGHPIRNGLPRFLEAVRARLKSPDLVVSLGSPNAEKSVLDAILQALGDQPEEGKARLVDTGAVVASVSKHGFIKLFLRPGQWDSGHPLAPTLRSLRFWHSRATFPGLDALTSEAFTRLAARVTDGELPAGCYEANPTASAPRIVKKAQKALGLSEPAAQLYLQLLALPIPTSAALQLFNGWTAQELAERARELIKKKLVLEAKRERAGREIFLPGGWEPLKAPLKPLESWKLPLFGATRLGDAVQWPMAHQLPLEPIHELFERAWKRIEDGDVPRYEELKR